MSLHQCGRFERCGMPAGRWARLRARGRLKHTGSASAFSAAGAGTGLPWRGPTTAGACATHAVAPASWSKEIIGLYWRLDPTSRSRRTSKTS